MPDTPAPRAPLSGSPPSPDAHPPGDSRSCASDVLSPHETEGKHPGTKLFIRLVLGVAGLMCLALGAVWLVPTLGFGRIHPYLPHMTAVVCVTAMAFILWCASSLILRMGAGRGFTSRRMRGVAVRLLLPLVELLGRVLGCPVDAVRRSFIEVNNDLVRNTTDPVPADKTLILLPHCLQTTSCPRRLIHSPDNCIRCGRCVQGGLLDLRDAWGVHLAVATGGTIARRIVKQLRPGLIIAAACERDLASGIQDTYPLPVYGVLNQCPNGPCIDTSLDLKAVEAALARFVIPPMRACSPEAAPPQADDGCEA